MKLNLKLLMSFAILCIFAPGLSNEVFSQETRFSDEDIEFFEAKVRPLLVDNCYECHGSDPDEIEGGLSVASRKSLLEGGDTGPAIVPGDPEESLLIDVVNYGEIYQMPPDSKMAAADIEILTEWIKRKAPWPAESDVAVAKSKKFDLQARKAAHWCWQPVKRPDAPAVNNQKWPRDEIDNFVLAKIEAAGLKPATTADKRTLIRRTYFDLIGLPPTPAEIDAFLNDDSDDPFAKVVDGLLDSPRFGERWARHWMDLTRYAETCGHEFDYPIPHAYEYRDYLIRAFNADVPYNQFITEHIAGDLIDQPRRHPKQDFNESVIGTGFWYLHEATHAPVDVKGDEAGRIDNQIDVLCKTFLGLTVACARCHDHKFDAISAADYYALSGFLQSSRRQVAMLDPGRKIERAYKQSQENVNAADDLLSKWIKNLETADSAKLETDVAAAIDWLRQDPDWNKPGPLKIQGEDFKDYEATDGEAKIQVHEGTPKFKLEGGKQLWWMDGEPGSILTMPFEIPKSFLKYKTKVELIANLAYASNYGKAKISLGENELKVIDFYKGKLQTKRVSLGTLELEAGEHSLHVELTGAHEKAAKRYMFGIDYLELKPVEIVSSDGPTVEEFAKEKKLNANPVSAWVNLIKNPNLSAPSHGLHFLRQSSRKSKDFRGGLSAKKLKASIAKANKKRESMKLFEDFNKLDGWFSSGIAFEHLWNDTPAANRFSLTGSTIVPRGTVNSGRYGKNLQGVLHSPTFTIEHDQIHIRCRGNKTRIRLIIDGFEMDTYNPLLFKGVRTDVNSPDRFSWLTLAGDLKNYRGHRAHLEFIDRDSGYCQLDEIRFSNEGPPGNNKTPSQFAVEVLKANPENSRQLAAAFVTELKNAATAKQPATDVLSLVVNHLSERQLGFSAIKGNKTNYVSFDGKSISNVRKDLAKQANKIPAPKHVTAMTSGTDENEFLFVRGNHKNLGKVVPKRFLEAINKENVSHESEKHVNGKLLSDRRKWLAEQFASDSNPLTRRVIVNRLWHHLMGRGIVASVDNFGVLGKQPTHPQLLDFLADEFSRNSDDANWSIKKMIRRIVLSQTYRMSSELDPAAVEIDPDNNLLHRANIKRLQGEVVRDSILKISGRLDDKMFGPSVATHLTSFMQGRGRPKKSGPLDGNGRRSVYLSVRRNFMSPFMLAFDTPTPFNAMGRRTSSNVPAQALILMNDPFVIEQSKKWANGLLAANKKKNDGQAVRIAWQQAIGREPSQVELDSSIAFLESHRETLNSEKKKADESEVWTDFCHVLFNLKEFIFIK